MGDQHLRDLERRSAAPSELAVARARHGLGGAVTQAHARWATGERLAALELLLERWRERRSPELAALVDALQERVSEERGPVEGTRFVAEKRAATLLKEGDAFDLARCLATWRALPCGRAFVHLSALTTPAPPADPRLATALHGLLLTTPEGWFGGKHAKFWRLVLRQLVRLQDPRSRRVVEAARMRPPTAGCLYYVLDEVPACLAGLPEPPPPDADEDAEVAAFLEDLRPKRASASLWEAARRDRVDLEARAALGAELRELGDPRGELIQLQLARAATGRLPTKEEKDLLRSHWETLAGSLRTLVAAQRDLRFTAGFVDQVVVKRLPRPGDVSAEDFATVERLTIEGVDDVPRLLDALPRIPRELAGIHSQVLGRHLPCELLSVLRLQVSDLRSLAERDVCPDLRALSFGLSSPQGVRFEPAEVRRFLGTHFARHLQHVWLRVDRPPRWDYAALWSWSELFPLPDACPLQTLKVSFEGGPEELLFVRKPGAKAWSLHVLGFPRMLEACRPGEHLPAWLERVHVAPLETGREERAKLEAITQAWGDERVEVGERRAPGRAPEGIDPVW